MRIFSSVGCLIALVHWSAETAVASPPPFLLQHRHVPAATSLGLYGMPFGLSPRAGVDDGSVPGGDLTYLSGALYGTTGYGGKYGLGTVFAVTLAGKERVLHSFGPFGKNGGSITDGFSANGDLIDLNGILYGTTQYGGSAPAVDGCGAVFAITPAGAERLIYSFRCGADGAYPAGGLTLHNGIFYGTTQSDGAYGGDINGGTVFELTSSGAERVVHSFGHGEDGQSPAAGLTYANGVLYGTTSGGGKYGHGTVFAMTTSGAERVLYSFGNGTDAQNPQAGLTYANGVLYGTTYWGGTYGGGTVFAVTTAGKERVLHSFSYLTNPNAGLIDVNGVLYGTAGAFDFAVTSAGAERHIHSFTDPTDGEGADGLVNVGGVLFGSTAAGGALGYDAGTVYELTTGGAERVLYQFTGALPDASRV